MERRFASLFAALLATGAWGQGSGPFAFVSLPTRDGISLTQEGMTVAGETLFAWNNLLGTAAVLQHSASQTTWGYVGGGPTKARASVFSPGIEIYFPEATELKIGGETPPFLSWTDGSAGPTIPTPAVDWILLSWAEPRVPVLVTFSTRPSSLVAKEGKLSIPEGWMRLFPLSVLAEPVRTPDAAALSGVVRSTAEWARGFAGSSPRLQKLEGRWEREQLFGKWTFDRPGALLPPFGQHTVPWPSTAEAVMELSIATRLRRPGRAIVAEPEMMTPAPRVIKPQEVAKTAIRMLLSSATPEQARALAAAEAAYLADTPYTADPLLKLRFPYDSNGEGLDAVGAQALSRFARGGGENPYWVTLLWAQNLRTGALEFPGAGGAAAMGAAVRYFSDAPFDVLRSEMFRWSLGTQNPGFLASSESVAQWESALESPARMLSGPPLYAFHSKGGYRLRWRVRTVGRTELRLILPTSARAVGQANIRDVQIFNGAATTLGTVVRVIARTEKSGEAWIELKGLTTSWPALPRHPDFVARSKQ